MIAAFHSTGATYERKNRRWLFSTPRHQALSTSRPLPGNTMRTRRMHTSRLTPVYPAANSWTISGAARMPSSTATDTTRNSSDATAPATRRASSWRFSSISFT